MGVTIEVKNPFGDVIKRKKFHNLNKNFFDTANKLIRERYRLGLWDYYEYNREFYKGVPFPFIIRDNKCEWHVPVGDVTIKDFMITHGIDDGGVITIDEVEICGGDPYNYVYDLVSWVPVLWPMISHAVTLAGVVKIVIPVYHKLIGKDKKVVKPYEFLELLKTRKEWTMDELKQISGIDNESKLEVLLIQGDFIKKGDNHYSKNTDTSGAEDSTYRYFDYIHNVASQCWGEYGNNPEDVLSGVIESAHYLNCSLTDLLLKSEFNNSSYFETMINIIDSFVDEWSIFVCKGQKLQFVTIKNDYNAYYTDDDNKKMLKSDLKMLEHDMEMLTGYAHYLSEKLTDKDS